MALLDPYIRRWKIAYFLEPLPKDSRILEVGCGDGWLGRYCRAHGWNGYVSLDLHPPADYIGDIREWWRLGLRSASFDAVIAFEVIEHVPCYRELYDLLKPGGLLLVTSPVPSRDWICAWLERCGILQKRTSPHDFLIDFRRMPLFEPVSIRRPFGLVQWGIFRKPLDEEAPCGRPLS